ncbi:MAG: threonine--tRNA ligase [Candidatus Niyogibacteria bacterium CG10_big_fil_rev_8_21_14_0_10_42_19]|uniref:Threonine--tRNA ligase n=1 Tax=Candidatus Niyogibacteria bacterium CG10_big_fil_rev_8_21_14_0_10_42_19 TaxID=1974725 RepID=A0A2H0TFK4_9BACT|nr:MAG: threonine--tRNA ligase [Candidatus Niyogibacteria bacterium CG10_big_fil_rev_8_21_14_0_10_42_19]
MTKPREKQKKEDNIRHSLSHLLAMAVLKKFPKAKLGIGPIIENGFYYDFLLPKSISPDDLRDFEKEMRATIKKNLPFKGKKITPREAKKMFSAGCGPAFGWGGKDQEFKLDLIKEYVKSKKQLTVYESGDFSDLCKGGHVKKTSEIDPDAFKLTKIASAYWRGDEKNPQLTRIYGVAFETKNELDDYIKLSEEIEKRDHRVLGERLELFMFSDVAPGAPIWLPNGMIIFRELEKLWRNIHDDAGYKEISTPILVKADLFRRSGHWDYYRENMFYFDIDKETYVLKPMNCPEATLVYSDKLRSYRDLPMRLSEIGRLHRNELSGTLGGLFRVRQLTMDDAHIFSRPDQIQEEIDGVLKLIDDFYKKFNFPAKFRLATKPKKAMGSPKLWKLAENALADAMRSKKIDFEILKGEGAFYGPKIHYDVKDALGREWTLATIQVDFQTPERFDLTYITDQGKKERPVMIHRAIFGSFERFIGVLIEHFAGALPLWLSPIQVEILSISDSSKNYAVEILHELKNKGLRVSADLRPETIGKKIREAEMRKTPYLIILGEREASQRKISVRQRGSGDKGQMTLADLTDIIKKEIE